MELSGIVSDPNYEAVSYAHVIIKNKDRGVITNMKGMFTIVTSPGDTVIFSAIGFKPVELIIPDSMKQVHRSIDIIMPVDTIMIAEVRIYPWKTYAEFKQAFVNLELPDDDAERARQNIALIKTQIILSNEPNPKNNFRYVMQNEYEKTMIQGQYPSIPILNPLNWARFIEALKEGRFKDEHKDLR